MGVGLKYKIVPALVIIVSVCFLGFILYFLYGFYQLSQPDIQYTRLDGIEIQGTGCFVEVFDIGGGATVGNALQVRKTCGGNFTQLKIIEGYNDVKSLSWHGDSLQIIAGGAQQKGDTMYIKVK